MKILLSKYRILVLLLMFFADVKGQNVGKLYGMTPSGGSNAAGVLFNYNTVTKQDSLLYQFPITATQPTYNNLIHAYDGYLYGMVNNDNGLGYGTIFRMDTAGNLKIIHVFEDNADGGNPNGSLVQASDSNFYGMTYQGGSGGAGTIFRCSTSGAVTTLYGFTGSADGGNPYGNVIIGKDGNLYGMTYQGGSGGYGTIFKCSTSGAFTVIYNFTGGTDGGSPSGSLVQATNGALYGMTYVGGGAANSGTIFKCTPSGTFDTLHTFTGGNDGGSPYGSLIQIGGKTLYGMTNSGGATGNGTIFKCDTLGNITPLYSFTGGNDGGGPYGDLLKGKDGMLYGMTNIGGSYGFGTIFKCDTLGNLTILLGFTGGNDGSTPYGSLMQTASGKLYGMTSLGGQFSNGNIFSCTTSGTEKDIFDFGDTNTNGNRPEADVIQGIDGSLYGMTFQGGSDNAGTIFKYTSAGTFATLYSFTGVADGGNPHGSLIQSKDSNLYGMTSIGGLGQGAIFKCSTTGAYTTLYSFTGNADGSIPYGNLVQDKNGNLYGMTSEGGPSNDGTIFKCTPSGTLTTLYSFTGIPDGVQPFGSLLLTSSGKLYGMTNNGGTQDYGIIFKCDTSGNLSVLYNFTNNTDGAYPYGSLLQATDGSLYGMTNSGGAHGYGAVFKCDTLGNLSTVYSFTGGTDGGEPYGSLLQASDSNFYGMTDTGGMYGHGTMFSLTLSGNVSTLINYNFSNGADPLYNNLLEVMNATITNSAFSCVGYTLTPLVAGGGAGAYKYTWSNGATTSSIDSIKTGGTFSCTVTNAKGITVSTNTITVPVVPIPNVMLNMTNATTVCRGSQMFTLAGGSPSGGIYNGTDVSSGQFNPDSSGIFPITYTFINGSGCSDSATESISVSICTGVANEVSNINEAAIYPNPNNGDFTMVLNGKGYKSVSVYDETGKLIYTRTLNSNSVNSTLELNMEMNAKGLYYAQLVTEQSTQYKKIIIQ